MTFYRKIQNVDANFSMTLRTREFSIARVPSKRPPSHGSRKIRFPSKCSANRPALVFREASGLGGDTKTTRALCRAARGKASRVSKT